MSITPESGSALKTIEMHQSVIARMSSASSTCKNWCVTIVVAVTVFSADKSNPEFVLLGLIPTLLFAALDTYYLALERHFRRIHEAFVRRLVGGEVTAGDLFLVGKPKIAFGDTLLAGCSRSVWPFYLLLGIALGITAAIANRT